MLAQQTQEFLQLSLSPLFFAAFTDVFADRDICRSFYLLAVCQAKHFLLSFTMTIHWDGHELGFLLTASGCYSAVHYSLPKGWYKGFIHRQPVAALCVAWATIGFALPLTVPPIRRRMGLPTNQYNAQHPMCVHPKYEL